MTFVNEIEFLGRTSDRFEVCFAQVNSYRSVETKQHAKEVTKQTKAFLTIEAFLLKNTSEDVVKIDGLEKSR